MSQPNPPIITSPHGGLDFTTNRTEVTFGGTVDLTGVAEVLVNGSSAGVSYVVDSGVWTADVQIAEGVNNLTFTAISDDITPIESLGTSVEVTFADDVGLVITRPTGITEDVLKSAVKVQWVGNPEPQVIGYNVYGSLTAGGGDTGYQKLNSLLISTVVEVRTDVVPVSSTISQVGDLRTTVTVDQIETQNVYELVVDSFDGSPLSLGQTLHLVVTAVAYDPSVSTEAESSYSEEIAITPLILTESRVEAPSRTQQQIATDYATLVRQAQPNLDIKPGTPTNDVHIQPPATEEEKLYFLIDFLSRAQSFVELVAIDDPNGDDVSDDVDEVPYKRALKAALSTDSNTITQNYIDMAFTRLAHNTGTERGTALPASNEYLFFTYATPNTDVSIPAGSLVSAPGNAEQGVVSAQYFTTVSVNVPVALISSYYNYTTERYEFPSFIQASVAGADGNRGVGEINVVTSGPNITLQGENPEVLSNGTDAETNASLALRSILAFRGVDTGTRDGYRKVAMGIPSVQSVGVVGAGCPDMQRDFDCFVRQHRGCKVDVYIQGETPLDHSDSVSFSYYRQEANVLTIVDATDFIFEVDIATDQLSVSSGNPLFEVTFVRNVTQAVSYDVDKIRFNGAQFTMDTTNPVNTGLVASDVVQANFRWRDGDKIVLSTQPVTSVTTVAGESSGPLVAGTNYNFDKSADPLLLGHSTRSDDGVVIQFSGGEQVSGEQHTLNGDIPSLLVNPDIATSTIVVTDLAGEIIYVEGSDYELDTYQCVLFEDETHQVSTLTTAFLNYDTVIRSSVEVRAGATPILVTEGVDYSIVEQGLTLGIKRLAGGSLTEGETVYVTYRIEIPVLLTTVARIEGATPASSIADGETVAVNYQKGVPRGRPILVEEEEKVLVGTEFVELSRKGVIEGTVVVIDPLSASPNTYLEGVDYALEMGTDDTATRIRRLDSGSIVDGSTVSITYRANENFTVSYTGNDLVRVVQDAIEVTRHVTADVLVKEYLKTDVDLVITVVPLRGVNRLNLISNIRTAISRHFNSLELGSGVFQADIIKVIEEVTGVDHTVVPFLRMTRSAGSVVLREEHSNPQWTLYASNISDAYRSLSGTLVFATTAGGGSPYLPRGVYEDDSPMRLVEDIGEVEDAFGRAYIASDGSIVVSPSDGDPFAHTYSVTYQVGMEMGVKDIRMTSLEGADLGEVSISLSDPEVRGVC